MKGVAVVVAGALSGFVGAWGALSLLGAKPSKAEWSEPPVRTTERQGTAPLVTILRSPAAEAPAASCSSSSTSPPVAALPSWSPEARAESLKNDRVAQRTAQRSRIAAHEQEPRNPNWATTAESSIREAFARLPTVKHAELDKVDCRWESCVMNISWKEPLEAQAEMLDVAGDLGPLSEYCTRTLVMDEHDTGPQRASVVFQCDPKAAGHQ